MLTCETKQIVRTAHAFLLVNSIKKTTMWCTIPEGALAGPLQDENCKMKGTHLYKLIAILVVNNIEEATTVHCELSTRTLGV